LQCCTECNTIGSTDSNKTRNMNKLKQEYILQVRNAIIKFLVKNVKMNVTDVADLFGLNKSTVSRIAQGNDVDRGVLLELTKYFK
jgi:DNA-directed RNA polymerase specialized sigma54-like protein